MYKNKYLKYKNKYLELLKISGGSKLDSSALVISGDNTINKITSFLSKTDTENLNNILSKNSLFNKIIINNIGSININSINDIPNNNINVYELIINTNFGLPTPINYNGNIYYNFSEFYENVIFTRFSNIRKLIFVDGSNQQIMPNILPQSLIKLEFDYYFNNGDQPLGNALSSLINLKELKFGYHFNQQIMPNSLPPSLIELIFDLSYNNNNQPLGNAFSNLINLQVLALGPMFNQ